MIKKRSLFSQVLLFIITFGIYGIYWFYDSARELKEVTKDETAAPGLWTIVLFIPFGAIYSHYQYGKLYEKFCSEKLNKWIIFLLWIVFFPAVWFLVQTDLNVEADKRGSRPPSQI